MPSDRPAAQIEAFLQALDDAWTPLGGEPWTLHVIGSAALLLHLGRLGDRQSTKDADIVETADTSPRVRARMEKLAGPQSQLHKEHRIYLEILAASFPFLPEAPEWLPLSRLSLRSFRVVVLDPTDVVVSKLARFNATDRADIMSVADADVLRQDRLLARFSSAVRRLELDARREEVPRYVKNLRIVERDGLYAWPGRLRLPEWADEESGG